MTDGNDTAIEERAIKRILVAAGVPFDHNNVVVVPPSTSLSFSENNDDGADDDTKHEADDGAAVPFRDAMANWLGLGEGGMECPTVEDYLPLSDEVYAAAAAWLTFVWKQQPQVSFLEATTTRRGGAGGGGRHHATKKNEDDDTGNNITLESLHAGVRATQWILQWNEYNLGGEEEIPLFARLLRSSSNDVGEALIQSFYTHLDGLSFLQHQINHLTNSGGSSTLDVAAVPFAERLKRIEATRNLSARLEDEWDRHLERVEIVLGLLYIHADAPQRKMTRRLLGRVWTTFTQRVGSSSIGRTHENTQAVAVAPTLRLLRRILAGMDTHLDNNDDDNHADAATKTATNPSPEKRHQLQIHEHSLLPVLMDLHQPDALVLWRDQTPVLELYHEPLCQCLAVLLQHNPSLLSTVLLKLPITGNSAKQVLLLHEVLHLLDLLIGDNSKKKNIENDVVAEDHHYPNDAALTYLTQQLAACMASVNSHIAEQALQFFRNPTFRHLALQRNSTICMPILLSALLPRQSSSSTTPHWNPTVRKMTLYVLEQMEAAQPALFIATCNDHHAKLSSSSLENNKFSLKAGMKGWVPPTKTTTKATSAATSGSLAAAQQPPATITGVAPWAQKSTISSSSSSSSFQQKRQPPATVTGVAPWASGGDAGGTTTRSPIMASPSLSATKGYDLAKAYMKQLQPKENIEEDGSGGASYWSRDQMADTTKVLPDLKFHDLVFGHELGTGAFGVVKYARHIVPNKTRSVWPEYAVKIVSTQKIRDHGYERSIQREIAILQLMHHPGIARLVSSFQYSDGVYLVLEYASGGDLHTVLRRQGSLSEAAAKFVMGEVLAALLSIHAMGIVYGDLKPENIVLTESGHAKLTDFGAARPVTDAAQTTVRANAKELLRRLRDGGWKKTTTAAATTTTTTESTSSSRAHDAIGPSPIDEDVDEEAYDDTRIEGTTAYLPPEVLSGVAPGLEADAWAFGCVTYQCLTGRPPLLDVDDERTRHRIIRFQDGGGDPMHANDTTDSVLFSNDRGSNVGEVAKAFVLFALTRSPRDRPTVPLLAQHAFFAGMNVPLLYKEGPVTLDVGVCTPQPNAQWSRRQMSSIWAPQPKSYDLSSAKLSSAKNHESFYGNDHDSPIMELDERNGLFVPRQANVHGPAAASRKRTNLLPPL